MRPHAIDLHIESIVLHGFEGVDRDALAGALEQHLSALLRDTARLPIEWNERETPATAAAPVRMKGGGSRGLGCELAASIHRAVVPGQPVSEGDRR